MSPIGMMLLVPVRHIAAAPRLTMAILATSAALPAQYIPPSIPTIPLPISGPAVFDSLGNTYYYTGGSVTPGAAQTQPGGGTCPVEEYPIGAQPMPCPDAYIAKVDPEGNLVYGTLLGGPTGDSGSALAVDSGGNVFITGSTGGQFPTTPNAAIPNSTTARTFAARLSADGGTFLYSTYLPNNAATATAIAIDAQDNAYITGKSVARAPYVIKLSPDGSTILYDLSLPSAVRRAPSWQPPHSARISFHLASGEGKAIAIDPAGNVIVVGITSSPGFPVTLGALQTSLRGVQNIFIVKLDPTGGVIFSTYLGGSKMDTPAAVGTDSAGNIYVAGATTSLDFPTTPGAFQPTASVPPWNYDSPGGFAAELTPSGSALLWSTYVMSIDSKVLEIGVGEMSVAPSGEVYLGGLTGTGFPVTASAPEPCFTGNIAGFIAHLDSQGALADATYLSVAPPYEINSVWGLAPSASGSVQVVWHYSGNDVASTIQFGTGIGKTVFCLSSGVPNIARQ
jgi:hypothetical protein